MRTHRSWKVGLAAGVMLVSGGCAGDVVGAGAPQSPRPTHLPVLVAVASAEDLVIVESEPVTAWTCRLIIVYDPKAMRAVDGTLPARDKTHDPKRIEPIKVLKSPRVGALDGPRAADGSTLVRTKRP